MRSKNRLAQKLAAPVPALPLDLFRIAAGVVVFGYLVRLLIEAPDIHGADGLVDHARVLEIFPFAWQPLFPAACPLWWSQALLGGACVSALAIAFGYRPRLNAAIAYVIVVAALRHRFLIVSVDDVIIHLTLFWLILLPTGRTLAWSYHAVPRRDWKGTIVPGATLRLFMINIAVLYLVAGITKCASPMWLRGDALYTVLKLRPGYFSEFLQPAHLVFLRRLNFATLVLEPLLCLIPFLPTNHKLKLFLGLVLIALHVGIIATLDVPFANLACLTFLPLLYRNELHALWRGRQQSVAKPAGRLTLLDRFAAVVVFFIIGAMVSSMTQVNWRKPTQENALLTDAPAQETAATVGGLEQKIFFGGLWAVGLIQQYRLLDWIDDRNFHVQLTVTETFPDGSTRTRPGTEFVPRSMRGCLTLAYIAGATWLPVPASQLRPLRESIHARLAQRYARRTTEDVQIEVTAEIKRIDPSHLSPAKTVTLTSFQCSNQTVSQHHMNLDL